MLVFLGQSSLSLMCEAQLSEAHALEQDFSGYFPEIDLHSLTWEMQTSHALVTLAASYVSHHLLSARKNVHVTLDDYQRPTKPFGP